MENVKLSKNQLIGILYTITLSGCLYPEQTKAIQNSRYRLNGMSYDECDMLPGEIARHLGRILKMEVKNTHFMRLNNEQKTALEQASKDFWQEEDNLNDAEKGRYD